jgi:hypothetical protein
MWIDWSKFASCKDRILLLLLVFIPIGTQGHSELLPFFMSSATCCAWLKERFILAGLDQYFPHVDVKDFSSVNMHFSIIIWPTKAPVVSGQSKVGNGVELDGVSLTVMKNWRHTMGATYVSSALQEVVRTNNTYWSINIPHIPKHRAHHSRAMR